MEDIVWLEKDRTTGGKKNESDCTIAVRKSGIVAIHFRNGTAQEITKTGHIRFGIGASGRNKLFFMSADKAKGWKLSELANCHDTTWTALIATSKYADALKRFEGDYDLEISDDNFFFINRRNVK